MVLLLLLASASPGGTTPVSRDIHAFCKEQPKCVAEQLEAARHFLGTTVMFDVPRGTAETCLRRGKVGRQVDWTVSLKCLREWTKGRKSVLSR